MASGFRTVVGVLSLAIALVGGAPTAQAQHSVARIWDEQLLDGIRLDVPKPPVHARNLFHLSVAMWDAWAAYDPAATGYIVHEKLTAPDVEAARAEAISFAAYRVLKYRFPVGFFDDLGRPCHPGAAANQIAFDAQMDALGYDKTFTSTVGDSPAALGNRIAAAVIAYGQADGAVEGVGLCYPDDSGYDSQNLELVFKLPGCPNCLDSNRWSPLAFDFQVTQNGIILGAGVQAFVGVAWGDTLPFALTPDDLADTAPVNCGSSVTAQSVPYLDPGCPPQLAGVGDETVKQAMLELIRFSSWTDPVDGVTLDISPGAIGNNALGTDDGEGHACNPATGQEYAPNVVKRADWTRVVAQSWSDGPKSETPPGHWNVLANYVADLLGSGDPGGGGDDENGDDENSDGDDENADDEGDDEHSDNGWHWGWWKHHDDDEDGDDEDDDDVCGGKGKHGHGYAAAAAGAGKRIGGVGPLVNDLEWDVKTYLALNGAVHDAAIASWSTKHFYDSARPIQLMRYMADLGQSSDPGGPSYHPDGLLLEPGLVEVTTAETTAPGGRHEHLAAFCELGENWGKPCDIDADCADSLGTGICVSAVGELAIRAWQGPPADPVNTTAGVGWIRASMWMPWFPRTFVTPPFPGYTSGHSTFSRSGAEVLTAITGSAFFPGGIGTFDALVNEYLEVENGPSETIQLQWATYFDAADEAGISRRLGGIHPVYDDFPARQMGSQVGQKAWAKALELYGGTESAESAEGSGAPDIRPPRGPRVAPPGRVDGRPKPTRPLHTSGR